MEAVVVVADARETDARRGGRGGPGRPLDGRVGGVRAAARADEAKRPFAEVGRGW